MLHEVVSTPTDQGVYRGLTGFCPVAVTRGMPRDLLQIIADISKRQYEYIAKLPDVARKMYCHLPLTINKHRYHLVARGFPNGSSDLAQCRSYVIHQLLLEQVGTLPAGAAWLLANDSIWIEQWNLEPEFLEPRELESDVLSPRICSTWAESTGDAGWAGAALDAWQKSKSFAIVVPPNRTPNPAIELFLEAQSLLEPKLRWQIPISISAWCPPKLQSRLWTSYFTGSKDAVNATRNSEWAVVDIGRKLGPAANAFSEFARSGAWARLDRMRHLNGPVGASLTDPQNPSLGFAKEADSLLRPASGKSVGQKTNSPSAASAKTSAENARRAGNLKNDRRANRIVPWRWIAVISILLVLAALVLWQGAHFVNNVRVLVSGSAPPAEKSQSP